MRHITKTIAQALRTRTPKSVDNTRCTGTSVLLHGNEVARVTNGELEVSLAGWPTPTTRERVNGILAEFGSQKRFRQSRGQQFFGERCVSSTEWIKV